MSAPIQKFSEPQEAFNIGTLKSLILQAKTLDELNNAKCYLLSYFMLCSSPHGVIMWRPDINDFEHKLTKEIDMLIRPITRTFYKPSNNPEERPEKIKFNILSWFLNDNDIVCVAQCDPSKP